MHRLNELRFVEFLARHRHDTVYLRHHVDGRRIVELTAHLYQVVHVIAENARVGCYIGAIALALLQLIELQEVLVRAVQLALLHELVVVEVGEHHRLVAII